MARTVATTSLILLLLSLLAVASADAHGKGRAPATMAGGRREIKDVATNREVQDLGRFAVEEHNHRLGHGGASDPVPLLLTFTRVAAAQEQVVAGKAYYLKVMARDRAARGVGGDRPFDAVVVVKAWLNSKELVSFTPSPK
ncbi:hypothetical protein ACP70R_011883 [Stipagrostis hirtigluma subsp. patula]